MQKTNTKGRITRRGFLKLSSAAVATAALSSDAKTEGTVHNATTLKDKPERESAPISGKIALEEHFHAA